MWHEKGCPNYIKEPTQHMIDSKVQHKNHIKTNEHNEKTKHTCSKIYLIQEGKTIINEWDNQLPKESKVPTNKPNTPYFSWWHKVPKRKKRFVFQKHTRKRIVF